VPPLENDESYTKELEPGELRAPPHVVFPGGGIFFYWQAGAVTYLRENGYDLGGGVSFSGASAGALTATLTATGVDFERATDLALHLAAEAGVWDRTGGLQGIWGPMIEQWLDELLPPNALDLVQDNRLSLLITEVPSFGKERVQEFRSRDDLIRCCRTSVHIPWFLDGKLYTKFREKRYIDGSFLAQPCHYVPDERQDALVLNYADDPAYQGTGLLDFVEAVNPEGIYNILRDGKRFAKHLEEQGAFQILPKLAGNSRL
jgi:predicted acylesterase/phospholipase RssA